MLNEMLGAHHHRHQISIYGVKLPRHAAYDLGPHIRQDHDVVSKASYHQLQQAGSAQLHAADGCLDTTHKLICPHRELDLAVAVKHDVGGLQVVVDDPAGGVIQVGQARADLGNNDSCLLLWQRLHAPHVSSFAAAASNHDICSALDSAKIFQL